MRSWLVVPVLVVCACEARERTEERSRTSQAASLVAEGRARLALGKHEEAIHAFKRAMGLTPQDVIVYLNLAEAYRAAGNEAAAVLTLKQAEAVAGEADPSLKRARAELYLKMHDVPNAIVELRALETLDLLTDPEVRQLALLLGRQGKVDEGYKALERIQQRSPDDPESKVVEAQLLLMKGEELLAARLMDRLVAEHPSLTSARTLRARYFLRNGQADKALDELTLIAPDDLSTAEVVTLNATALNALGRLDESVALLERAIASAPRSAEALALLAETKLELNQGAEAQVLVDRALALEPRWARAVYVRGWAMEQQGQLEQAQREYEVALKNDPAFVPALARLWKVYELRGQVGDAIATLERLFQLGALTPAQKIDLARLYSVTWANVDRGRALIDEALKKDPRNAELKAIKARLAKGKPKGSSGVQIIKGR